MKVRPLTGTSVLALGNGITLLGVIRVLGLDGATALALSDADASAKRSRWYRPAPPAMTAMTPATLATRLDALADGTVLVPCSDDWTQAVARLPDAMRARFPACVAAPCALDVLVDKAAFRATLERLGLPHPHTVAIHGERDLDAMPESVWANHFLKPADSQKFFGQYGVKAFPVTGIEETRRNLQMSIASGHAMMLQEYIPGPPRNHYFVDGFIDRQGTPRAVFARRRLRMFPSEYGNSSLMVSVAPSEVAEAVRTVQTLLADLHYRGIYSAEFKRDARDGKFSLIEVNARPWWYVEFAARCGVDVCLLAVKDALGMPVQNVGSYAVGRRCAYWAYDWHASKVERAAGRLTLAGTLASWIGAAHPVFRWNDPGPMLGAIPHSVLRRLR
jgi:predicted ATP-grasp superfamily ATP-dependent carboligase